MCACNPAYWAINCFQNILITELKSSHQFGGTRQLNSLLPWPTEYLDEQIILLKWLHLLLFVIMSARMNARNGYYVHQKCIYALCSTTVNWRTNSISHTLPKRKCTKHHFLMPPYTGLNKWVHNHFLAKQAKQNGFQLLKDRHTIIWKAAYFHLKCDALLT